MATVSAVAAAGLYLTAQEVLGQSRRFGTPSTRHAALRAVLSKLDGAVRVGALTPADANAAARRAVLAAETEPVRLEAERQGVFEHVREGRRVVRHRDERGEWVLETTESRHAALRDRSEP